MTKISIVGFSLMILVLFCLFSALAGASANPVFEVNDTTGQIEVCEVGVECVQLTTGTAFNYSDIEVVDSDIITYKTFDGSKKMLCTMHWRTSLEVCLPNQEKGE